MGAAGGIAVWSLFILAGLLVGGTWSFYQQGHKGVTVALGILAALSLAGALVVLIGSMPS